MSTEYPNTLTAAEFLGLTEDDFQSIERGDVVAPVKQCTVRDGARILSVRCPYCGEIHTHGGGRVNEAPSLGHRQSHCADKVQRRNDGYVLIDPAGICAPGDNSKTN